MVKPSPFDLYELEYRLVCARNRLFTRLARRDDPGARKIFVIGHPRTATATIHQFLIDSGIRARHTAGRWRTAEYDAFSDRGNYQPFDLLDRYYPNSTFVLNTRPVANYLRSRVYQTRKGWRNRGLPQPKFSAAHARNEILRRNNDLFAAARHFVDRDNLIVMNIERPGAFRFMCRHLGLEWNGDIWRSRTSKSMDDDLAASIDAAFEQLGASEDRDNPFVIRSLLDEDERATLDRFLEVNAERVYL